MPPRLHQPALAQIRRVRRYRDMRRRQTVWQMADEQRGLRQQMSDAQSRRGTAAVVNRDELWTLHTDSGIYLYGNNRQPDNCQRACVPFLDSLVLTDET